MTTAAGGQPDFMIKGLFSFRLWGQKLWITTTDVGVCVVTLVLILAALYASRIMRRAKPVPGTAQNLLESVIELLESFITGTSGHTSRGFFNYTGTLFLFILFCNISGLFGIRTPTADFGVTFVLGLITFFLVQYYGLKHRGLGHFTALFKPYPVLFPIQLISEIANPISLSLRLFGNMVSGVIIMGLWYGMMPFLAKIGIPAVLQAYFDLFSGCIQAYVFCMLTMVYVNEKREPVET